MRQVVVNGRRSENRTGVDTFKLFNQSMTILLDQGFPIVTAKKVYFRKALAEFIWMLRGETSTQYLNQCDVKWWNDFADEKGELGKVYGYQMRSFGGHFDQVEYALEQIKKGSRRAVISLWNPNDLEDQALPCCFTQMIFYRDGENLSMHITFRSSDLFLGLPYDVMTSALMVYYMAKMVNLVPDRLAITLVDAHVYECHNEQIKKYLSEPISFLPGISIGEDLSKSNLDPYKSGPFIKAKLVV